MKRFERLSLWIALTAVFLSVAVISQWYLHTHLVVSAEGHEHAHAEGEDEHHAAEGSHAHHEEEGETGGGEPLTGVNLITNHSFEVGSLLDIYAWTPKGTGPGRSAWWEQGMSAAGYACAALEAVPSSGGSDLVWEQAITSFPRGMDLEIGAKVKTAGLKGNAFVRLSGFRAVGEGEGTILARLYLSGLKGDNDWSEMRGVVYVPRGTELLVLEAGLFGTGKVWLDSVSAVAREHVPSPPPARVNLLENPDFSRGLQGWSLMFDPPDSAATWALEGASPAGSPAVRLWPPSSADGNNRIFLYQSVSGLEGVGGIASLSGMADARGLEGQAFLVLVFYTDEGMESSGPVALPGGNGWSPLSVDMRVPECARTAFAYLVAEGRGSALFSDVELLFLPAP